MFVCSFLTVAAPVELYSLFVIFSLLNVCDCRVFPASFMKIHGFSLSRAAIVDNAWNSRKFSRRKCECYVIKIEAAKEHENKRTSRKEQTIKARMISAGLHNTLLNVSENESSP